MSDESEISDEFDDFYGLISGKGYIGDFMVILYGSEPMSGQRLKEKYREESGVKVIDGTLYNVLKSLEEGGFVARNQGDYDFTNRSNAYGLTELGESMLEEHFELRAGWLNDPNSDEATL